MNIHDKFYGEIQIYAYMLIYHQRPSLSASLDRIQKIGEIESIYLFIYLLKKRRFFA